MPPLLFELIFREWKRLKFPARVFLGGQLNLIESNRRSPETFIQTLFLLLNLIIGPPVTQKWPHSSSQSFLFFDIDKNNFISIMCNMIRLILPCNIYKMNVWNLHSMPIGICNYQVKAYSIVILIALPSPLFALSTVGR